VNNAGKSAAGRIDEVSDDVWIADLELKVHAAVRLTRLTVPHLIAAGGGAIVNVLNVGAKAAGAASLPTTASRAAGLAITKAASKDLGRHGIRVNAVLIGLVASGQWQRRADAAGQSEEELYSQMAKNADIPLGRVGRSEEFADLAAYLLSDRSSYVTGSAVNLDGGSSPVLLSPWHAAEGAEGKRSGPSVAGRSGPDAPEQLFVPVGPGRPGSFDPPGRAGLLVGREFFGQ
jgi:NAD(P)-dependent dehydrogenase (short-subunit alcohol dehydrogenase family)